MSGQVITFYSFKGGVGRTMTMANIAFITALNGYRVLVMDWDLEAPGLSYYFRGLLDGQRAKALRETPGVLDLAWEWTSGLRTAQTDKEYGPLIDRFKSGQAFDTCVFRL